MRMTYITKQSAFQIEIRTTSTQHLIHVSLLYNLPFLSLIVPEFHGEILSWHKSIEMHNNLSNITISRETSTIWSFLWAQL